MVESSNPVTRRQFLIGAALTSAAMLELAACSPSKSSPAGTGAASGSGSTTGSAAASQGGGALTPTGTLDAAYVQSISSLDPHGANSADPATLLAARQIFDTLVVKDNDQYAPSLAASWSQPDPQTWVFKLRPDVTFHDGTPVTSSDVKASIERVIASKGSQGPLWAALTSSEVTDPQTLTLKTSQPLGTMLANLTLMFVVPAAKVTDPNFFNKPTGSGPFVVKSFTPGSNLTLSAAPNYWGTKAKVATVNVPYIAETSTVVTSLLNGSVDLAWPIPPDQVGSLTGKSGIHLSNVQSYEYYFTWFNCGKKPFSDVRVRQAMWYAVDLESIVKSLFGSSATTMDAPIPSTVFGYAGQTPYAHDPDKAKQLLTQAGYPDGLQTTLLWYGNTGPLATDLAQAMISDWAKVGVKVTPNQVEKATWTKRLNALEFDMDFQTNTVLTGDADYTLGRLYTSKADRMGYKNPTLDGILANASATTDQSQRASLYAQACKIIWDDAVGVFPAALTATYAVRSDVQNFTPVASTDPTFAGVTVSK